MQIFIEDALVFSKKLRISFDPENMKKLPLKVALNRHPTFLLCTGPAAQKQKSRSTKSPLMQDWVFRLGSQVNLLRS
jgi:hypothetical protein